MTGDFPSGESLKTAEMPLLQRTRDRQLAFGATWQSLFRYWFIAQKQTPPKNIKLNWTDMTREISWPKVKAIRLRRWPRKLEHAGVPKKQLLLEKGYTQDQIDQFESDMQKSTKRTFRTQQTRLQSRSTPRT